VSQYQKSKTNLDFTEARDSEWMWHQLGHMQVCISLPTDNHASTPPLILLQAGCPSCRPTNSVKNTEGKDEKQKSNKKLKPKTYAQKNWCQSNVSGVSSGEAKKTTVVFLDI